MDLKTALNTCKPAGYTRISDLRENVIYPIRSFERVGTPFGETTMTTLEGLAGDDPLRVYMPRRYNTVLGEQAIVQYNAGLGPRMHLVKKNPPAGSNLQAAILEFV